MNERGCRRYRVRGKVQGVWFRESTRQQAVSLGLTGRATNLPDGSVEVIAIGELVSLERLKDWLRRGPPLARVESVSEDSPAEAEMAEHAFDRFETR